jgi:D-glycero-D-manno-heptose 1,7-bisphosphate phosphatase
MVGDSLRDLEAAWEENCQAVLVRTGKGVTTLEKHLGALEELHVFDDLAEVARILCQTAGFRVGANTDGTPSN